MKITWCGREDLKRFLAILKDLQGSGQQAAIIGHFTIQLGHIHDVTNADNMREQSKVGLLETDAGKNPNRYTTEQEQESDRISLEKSIILYGGVIPLDLARVIGTWSNLPESVKKGIVAMIEVVASEE